MFTHTKPTLVRYNAIPNTYTIYIVVSFILCAFVVVVATFFFLMMTDDLYTTTPCISEWYVVCGSNIDLFICESLVALQTNAWNLICSIIVCMDGWYCLLGIYFFLFRVNSCGFDFVANMETYVWILGRYDGLLIFPNRFDAGKTCMRSCNNEERKTFFISIDESIRLLWVLKALFAYATGFSSKGIIILCFAYFAIYIYLYTTYKRRRSLMVCIYKW